MCKLPICLCCLSLAAAGGVRGRGSVVMCKLPICLLFKLPICLCCFSLAAAGGVRRGGGDV